LAAHDKYFEVMYQIYEYLNSGDINDQEQELLSELSAKLYEDGYDESKAQEIWDSMYDKLYDIDSTDLQESFKEIFESVLGLDDKYMSVTNQMYEYLNSDDIDKDKEQELLSKLSAKLYKDGYDESKAKEVWDGIYDKLDFIDSTSPQDSVKEIFESVLGGDHKYLSVTNQIYEYLYNGDTDDNKKEDLLTKLSAKLVKDGYDQSKAQEVWDGIEENISSIDATNPKDLVIEIFESVLGGDHKYLSVTNQIYEYINNEEWDSDKKRRSAN